MRELSLFNIGFRCENAIRALKHYKTYNTSKKLIIEDSERIIKDCFKFNEKITNQLSGGNRELMDFLPLVFELFRGKKLQEMKDTLEQVLSIILDIKSGKENIDVDSAIDFFRNLSLLCMSKNYLSSMNSSFTLVS